MKVGIIVVVVLHIIISGKQSQVPLHPATAISAQNLRFHLYREERAIQAQP
jgi:hypothetical protein